MHCLCSIDNSFTCLVKSKPVKQEVSCTVILPPMASFLWLTPQCKKDVKRRSPVQRRPKRGRPRQNRGLNFEWRASRMREMATRANWTPCVAASGAFWATDKRSDLQVRHGGNGPSVFRPQRHSKASRRKLRWRDKKARGRSSLKRRQPRRRRPRCWPCKRLCWAGNSYLTSCSSSRRRWEIWRRHIHWTNGPLNLRKNCELIIFYSCHFCLTFKRLYHQVMILPTSYL